MSDTKKPKRKPRFWLIDGDDNVVTHSSFPSLAAAEKYLRDELETALADPDQTLLDLKNISKEPTIIAQEVKRIRQVINVGKPVGALEEE